MQVSVTAAGLQVASEVNHLSSYLLIAGFAVVAALIGLAFAKILLSSSVPRR